MEARSLNTQRYAIKTMSRMDLDLAVEWAAVEGWNPGLHDADAFFATDPDGYLVGKLDGEPIASISAVQYGSNFGFIGFYIVQPMFRGKGHGLAIWNAAMQRLEGRNIGLDGVIDQQENYRESGFNLAYRNVRHAAHASACVKSTHADTAVIALSALPFASLLDYDRAFFPDSREVFLRRWLAPPAGHALACMKGEALCGYGVIRQCRNGHKIGPLFADNAAVADTLMSALCARVPGDDQVFLDIPEVNPAAIALAERRGMSRVFETARMYTGPAPDIPLDRLFGVTTFELG
jgi:GNAT superfamily N-acetyltransferase